MYELLVVLFVVALVISVYHQNKYFRSRRIIGKKLSKPNYKLTINYVCGGVLMNQVVYSWAEADPFLEFIDWIENKSTKWFVISGGENTVSVRRDMIVSWMFERI